MKIKLYDTPNSWWYIGGDVNVDYGWCSFYAFTKVLTVYWGKNAHLIQ